MMNTRLNILRNYETYCYQICYHMLRDERLAVGPPSRHSSMCIRKQSSSDGAIGRDKR